MDAERCVLCNEIIPEGIQVCQRCAINAGIDINDTEAAAQLKDIADILAITQNTDANIKKAVQGILNIATRLERNNNN